MDSVNSEDSYLSSCENLNNAHVFEFLNQLGNAGTAKELMSFERCPEGLVTDSFKRNLRNLKDTFSSLRKCSYRGGVEEESFRSYSTGAYVYPSPIAAPAPRREDNASERELAQIGDAETYAKVALEVGAELNTTKQTLERVKQKSKRTIEQLTEKVEKAKAENHELSSALTERDQDYKR